MATISDSNALDLLDQAASMLQFLAGHTSSAQVDPPARQMARSAP